MSTEQSDADVGEANADFEIVISADDDSPGGDQSDRGDGADGDGGDHDGLSARQRAAAQSAYRTRAARRRREAEERKFAKLEGEISKLQQELLSVKGHTAGSLLKAQRDAKDRDLSAKVDGAARALEQAENDGDVEATRRARERYHSLIAAKDRELADIDRKLGALNSRLRAPNGGAQPSADANGSDGERPARPAGDPKLQQWVAANPWFNDPDKSEMRDVAMEVHRDLVEQGVAPTSDDYYKRIDAAMRKEFPDEFAGRRRQTAPAAAAAGSSPADVGGFDDDRAGSRGARRVVLTAEQKKIAERMNVPLKEYAKLVADAKARGDYDV